MPGAGYDIGASVAQSWSTPLTANTTTTINFGSGTFITPTTQDITSEPISVATTKSPGTTNEIGGTGSGQSNSTTPQTGYAQNYGLDVLGQLSGSGNNNTLIYIGLGIIAILLIKRR